MNQPLRQSGIAVRTPVLDQLVYFRADLSCPCDRNATVPPMEIKEPGRHGIEVHGMHIEVHGMHHVMHGMHHIEADACPDGSLHYVTTLHL
jgi:hypothetical protein